MGNESRRIAKQYDWDIVAEEYVEVIRAAARGIGAVRNAKLLRLLEQERMRQLSQTGKSMLEVEG